MVLPVIHIIEKDAVIPLVNTFNNIFTYSIFVLIFNFEPVLVAHAKLEFEIFHHRNNTHAHDLLFH